MNTMESIKPEANRSLVAQMTADVVSAYVENNPVPVADLPRLIAEVHGALVGLTGKAREAAEEVPVPAVNPKRSVKPDHIICLECGKSFKSMKRHLGTYHDISVDDYRAKWNLAADYPMVAPDYTARRSALARSMGLGRKPGRKARK